MTKGPETETQTPQIEQKQKPRSFDQLLEEYQKLLEEYQKWRNSLPEEERNQPYLWEQFLLQVEDDGGYAFGRAIDDTLQGRQRDIARMAQDAVRNRNIEQILPEIIKLATIANGLSDRFNGMWEYDEKTGTSKRKISPPLVQIEKSQPLVEIIK